LDQTHVKIRESSAALADERRVFADLQRKSDERKARHQRITNLQAANARMRDILSANNRPGTKPAEIRTDIEVGAADAGLEINTSILGDPDEPFVMTPPKREYLATLPSTAVLNARVTAYKKHNARLEAEAKSLQSRSSGLENQLRKIVSLCIGVEESRVDEMVDSLSTAVASEGGEDVEAGRIRDFLRRVEGTSED